MGFLCVDNRLQDSICKGREVHCLRTTVLVHVYNLNISAFSDVDTPLVGHMSVKLVSSVRTFEYWKLIYSHHTAAARAGKTSF